jgi:hypothetical protein
MFSVNAFQVGGQGDRMKKGAFDQLEAMRPPGRGYCTATPTRRRPSMVRSTMSSNLM